MRTKCREAREARNHPKSEATRYQNPENAGVLWRSTNLTWFAVRGVSQIYTNKYSGRFYATQYEHPTLPCPQTASSGIENVFGVEWRRRGDALRWTGARMTGKKARCVVCIGKHNPCAECKRKKKAAAAPSASCQRCRQSPCD